MKNLLAVGILGALLAVFAAPDSFGQTAEEVLDKMIAAQGGREALGKIEDRTFSGTMSMVAMGTSGSISMYQKKPNKMRMEFEMMGAEVAQGFDGKTAWSVNPQTGEAQELPERGVESFKRQAIGLEALLHPDKYGVQYAYSGKKKANEKDCHVLEQTFSDGHKANLYIDAGTYLLLKTTSTDRNQMGAEVSVETVYGDYKKVEGITVPHTITVLQGGQEVMRVTVAEVIFNSGLKDSLFKMSR